MNNKINTLITTLLMIFLLTTSLAKAPFLSRGDNSGTHKKKLRIWKTAGVTPDGKWYVITKDFMMATLKKANEMKGYFI